MRSVNIFVNEGRVVPGDVLDLTVGTNRARFTVDKVHGSMGHAKAVDKKSGKAFIEDARSNHNGAGKFQLRVGLTHDFARFEPFGWEQQGALISFSYNTPNNSPPVMWWRGHETWRPLLPRKS